MFQSINLGGQYIQPMVEIINRAAAKVQQNPTPPKQTGYGILAHQQGNNPTALDLQQKVLSILAPMSNAPYQQTAQVLDLLTDLCMVTAALRVQNPHQQYGTQAVNELQQVKASIANAVTQLTQPAPQQYGQYTPAPYDPYAGQQAPNQFHQQPQQPTPRANDWITGVPDTAHQNRFDSSASSGIGFETIGGIDEEPVRQAPAVNTLYQEPVHQDNNGSILDAFNQPQWDDDGIFDDIDDQPAQVMEHRPMDNETEQLDTRPECTIDHEVLNDISELKLFDTHQRWFDTLTRDGNHPLGIVVVAGSLHVPVSRMTRKSTCHLGHIAFNTVRDMSNGKANTELKYIAIKDLPMDYNTLSPNPIVIHTEENIVCKPADLIDKEFAYRVAHETIACPDDAGASAASIRCTSLLISVGNVLSDKVKTRAKNAIFIAWESMTIDVVEAVDVDDIDLPTYEDDADIATIFDKVVSVKLRERVKNKLSEEVNKMLNTRYEFPTNALEWDDIVQAWGDLIEAVSANSDYSYDDVKEEFTRCLNKVLRGSHYRITPVADCSNSHPSWNSEDIEALSYTTPEEKTAYFSVEVMRPIANLGSWLTIEELGLSKDERLSTATHHTIAEPILAVFEKYPTLTEIEIYDVDGIPTNVYRGLNKGRPLVRCN